MKFVPSTADCGWHFGPVLLTVDDISAQYCSRWMKLRPNAVHCGWRSCPVLPIVDEVCDQCCPPWMRFVPTVDEVSDQCCPLWMRFVTSAAHRGWGLWPVPPTVGEVSDQCRPLWMRFVPSAAHRGWGLWPVLPIVDEVCDQCCPLWVRFVTSAAHCGWGSDQCCPPQIKFNQWCSLWRSLLPNIVHCQWRSCPILHTENDFAAQCCSLWIKCLLHAANSGHHFCPMLPVKNLQNAPQRWLSDCPVQHNGVFPAIRSYDEFPDQCCPLWMALLPPAGPVYKVSAHCCWLNILSNVVQWWWNPRFDDAITAYWPIGSQAFVNGTPLSHALLKHHSCPLGSSQTTSQGPSANGLCCVGCLACQYSRLFCQNGTQWGTAASEFLSETTYKLTF